ncbi:MAG TPA: UDP-N-acetylglucosamine 1-carboxyvinyltransferase [Myxococcota bacterium]|nr:UDP-N-acetylglucosamine 1-carboxyvinyltransferase [Myxococcota bacterium]
MDQFRIEGGVPLKGAIGASGSKNSVLALMAAALLSDRPVTLSNTPHVRDLDTMLKILDGLGVRGGWESADTLRIEGGEPTQIEAPYDLVRTMRASFMVLGPLLARCGHARVSLPGGCAIGARPVDQHLKGMAALGAKIELEGGYVEARASRLRGARVTFDVRTVNGTQNVLMAACLADGVSEIENAACEPEVQELITVLRAMGARIDQASSEHLIVQGVSSLSGVRHTVAGDRIEAGTLLAAGALLPGGDVKVTGIVPEHSGVVLEKLREAGLDVEVGSDWARVRRHGSFRGLRVKTAPFPGFPTDMQAQIMALLTQAEGVSAISENIFENRYMHVPELVRLGADIEIEGKTAVVNGPSRLSGAPVMATDLRASASLVLAGLAASGETRVRRVYHIDRGYERIEEKLARLGGRIRREAE